VDTAAATTVLNEADVLASGIVFGTPLTHHQMRGVGGSERSAAHRVDRLVLWPDVSVTDLVVHVGPASYGRDLGGLLGLDFLRLTGAIINLRDWTIEFAAGAVQSPQ
jgi:aspartyl protease